jgi:hypothetical protein
LANIGVIWGRQIAGLTERRGCVGCSRAFLSC